jgi:hypothetical protein
MTIYLKYALDRLNAEMFVNAGLKTRELRLIWHKLVEIALLKLIEIRKIFGNNFAWFSPNESVDTARLAETSMVIILCCVFCSRALSNCTDSDSNILSTSISVMLVFLTVCYVYVVKQKSVSLENEESKTQREPCFRVFISWTRCWTCSYSYMSFTCI